MQNSGLQHPFLRSSLQMHRSMWMWIVWCPANSPEVIWAPQTFTGIRLPEYPYTTNSSSLHRGELGIALPAFNE